MRYFAAIAVLLLMFITVGCPSDKPAPGTQTTAVQAPVPAATPAPSGPKLSSENRLLLLHAYSDAFAYSNDQQRRMNKLCEDDLECKLARENTTKAIKVWNETVPKVIQDEKLPAGTGFNVDVASGQVFVVLPPTIGAEKK